MIRDIFIGVDGGGTKSKVRIEHATGELIGQAVSGPANIRLSVNQAWQSIYDGIDEALKHAGLDLNDPRYHFHAGFGLAGCELKEACDTFLSAQHPFKTLQLHTDAFIACMGAHKGKDGAIIIVGTGVVGYQIQAGKGTKTGGWGFPHDDEGGGAWLGLEAVRLTLQWLDHRAERSPLAEDVFAFFNHDLPHLIAWTNRANSTEFARLAPIVINHAAQEEIAAVRIMKKAAHAVDRIGSALTKMRTNPEEPFPYSLFGGIAPFIEPWLHEDLRAMLVPRQADASTGAIVMIREYVLHAAQVVEV